MCPWWICKRVTTSVTSVGHKNEMKQPFRYAGEILAYLICNAVRKALFYLKLQPSIVFTENEFDHNLFTTLCMLCEYSQIDSGSFVSTGLKSSGSRSLWGSCWRNWEPRRLFLVLNYPSLHHVFGMTYHLNSAPFLYPHHRHCRSQHIHLLYPSPRGLPLKIKMSSLQTLLPWPIWSFSFSVWTTHTLTFTLSPHGILEIGPELLLTPPLVTPLLIRRSARE